MQAVCGRTVSPVSWFDSTFGAMVIAVTTRLFGTGQWEEDGLFIKEVVSRLARQYPQHQFYFLTDRPLRTPLQLPANIALQVVGPAGRNSLLLHYWYAFKLPRALKKLKADVLVAADGICAFNSKVPQCLIVPHLAFLNSDKGATKSFNRFYQQTILKSLKKAASIVTFSNYLKNEIARTYGTPDGKIAVVQGGARENFQPLDWEEQTAVKEKYTEGREYFITTGYISAENNLVNLLKAFSFFKKRQQSGMKLVLTGPLGPGSDVFLELLKTFKYRDDVVVLSQVSEVELPALVGAAYALVHPSVTTGFGVAVAEAMQSGVPVLAAANSAQEEMTGGAALYFDPHNTADMAEQLMRMYKDETGRSRLIEKGLEVVRPYSWQQAAEGLWQCITAVVKP